MRNVSAMVDQQRCHRPRDLADNSLNLGWRAILVILALNSKKRAGDMREAFLNIPIPELSGKPDVGPAPEHRIRLITMKFGKSLLQVCALIDLNSTPYTLHRDVLDKNMCRFSYDS